MSTSYVDWITVEVRVPVVVEIAEPGGARSMDIKSDTITVEPATGPEARCSCPHHAQAVAERFVAYLLKRAAQS